MKAVSGLDVHKDTIFACVLQKGKAPFIKEYTSLTCGIEELRNDLQTKQVSKFGCDGEHRDLLDACLEDT